MIIDGTPADDTLIGTAGNDTITGLDGNDLINGGAGDNILNGGMGDDTIIFGPGQQTVNGGMGNDSLELNFPNQTEDFVFTYNVFEDPSPTTGGILDGTTVRAIEQVNVISGSGNDMIDIATASLDSSIAGGAGDDAIIGGLGNDLLEGEAGSDTFFGGAGNDEIIGGEGNDAAVFLGLASNYEVVLGENSITVTGGVSDAPLEETEGETPLPVVEFTDTLSEVEVILFENGEIVVETGEFISFEADSPADEEPTIIESDGTENDIPVYKFLRTDTQTQFYTTQEVERDTILETLPQYELEGISFVGAAPPPEGEDITGISPVYRFFNESTGIHLYTADENERTFVAENLDNYVAEGTPYYGYDTQIEGTVPLYRFYNESLDAHFYTPSAEERDTFIASPDYQPEGGSDGIAFYVEPAPEV